jgi:hypothetical protein
VHELDGKGLIDIISCADSLAWMMAYAAAYARERMLFLEELKGFPVFPGIYKGYKTLDADMGGTGCFAGSGSPFAYSISAGNCLGILLEYGFTD